MKTFLFYRTLADIIAGFHLIYVIFATGGQAAILIGAMAGWEWVRNPAFRLTHLGAVGLVGIEAAVGMSCPLTIGEYRLREMGGERTEEVVSFIARIVNGVIYYNLPSWMFVLAHIGFAIIVILTFIFFPPRFYRQKRVQS
ncbi:MAG TPA: DUF2784 domain-containing protein [Syntrophorhabdaceae bacterium]|jgi:hypothetical protein